MLKPTTARKLYTATLNHRYAQAIDRPRLAQRIRSARSEGQRLAPLGSAYPQWAVIAA